MMTAPMIEWTLELLEWIRDQLFECWPEASMRGSAPELTPEGYKVRFRDQGRQFWLILSPDAIWKTSVADVRSALEAENWIPLLREQGTLSVGADCHSEPGCRPVVVPIHTMELKARGAWGLSPVAE